MKGVVARWLTSYGFIEADEEDEDIFVHVSEVESGEPLQKGQKVTFEVEEGRKGPKAKNVKVVEETEEQE